MQKSTKNRLIIGVSVFCAILIGVLIGVVIRNIAAKEPMDLGLTIFLLAVIFLIIAVCGAVLYRLLNRLDGVQKKLDKMAYYDYLTELPNRRFLVEYFTALEETDSKEPFALFFIDMDNFKVVNDSEGHDKGDILLKATGNYLQKSVLGENKARIGAGLSNVVVRFGGDEFILIIKGLSSKKEASHSAQQLIDNFAGEDIDCFVEKYGVGLSVGVAFYPYHSDKYHLLISCADESMYIAKRQGKNNFNIYDEISAKHRLLSKLDENQIATRTESSQRGNPTKTRAEDSKRGNPQKTRADNSQRDNQVKTREEDSQGDNTTPSINQNDTQNDTNAIKTDLTGN